MWVRFKVSDLLAIVPGAKVELSVSQDMANGHDVGLPAFAARGHPTDPLSGQQLADRFTQTHPSPPSPAQRVLLIVPAGRPSLGQSHRSQLRSYPAGAALPAGDTPASTVRIRAPMSLGAAVL